MKNNSAILISRMGFIPMQKLTRVGTRYIGPKKIQKNRPLYAEYAVSE